MRINFDTHSKLVVGSHGSKRDVADGSTTAYRGLREQVRIGSRCCLLLAIANVVRVSILHAFLQILASLTQWTPACGVVRVGCLYKQNKTWANSDLLSYALQLTVDNFFYYTVWKTYDCGEFLLYCLKNKRSTDSHIKIRKHKTHLCLFLKPLLWLCRWIKITKSGMHLKKTRAYLL